MLRNLSDCYCESTHRLLQKYDRMRKKAHKSRFTFEYRSFVLEIKQTTVLVWLNDKKTNTEG